jgi:hypothetical protein
VELEERTEELIDQKTGKVVINFLQVKFLHLSLTETIQSLAKLEKNVWM